MLTAACATRTLPTKPPKPKITIEARPDGGICLDRENTIRLGAYILKLEQGYR
jgi:hypothetical protein